MCTYDQHENKTWIRAEIDLYNAWWPLDSHWCLDGFALMTMWIRTDDPGGFDWWPWWIRTEIDLYICIDDPDGFTLMTHGFALIPLMDSHWYLDGFALMTFMDSGRNRLFPDILMMSKCLNLFKFAFLGTYWWWAYFCKYALMNSTKSKRWVWAEFHFCKYALMNSA